MKFELFGIPINLGGEDPLNDKLERYHELAKDAETETLEEWLDSPPERLDLYMELLEEGVIVNEDEPQKPWWHLW
jgi:hypothetical protein